jgi:hypothetical protein
MSHQKCARGGGSLAELHLHLGETRRSAAGAALIFLDERESVGLLEELSAVGAEPLGGSAGLDKVRGPGQGLPSSLAGGQGPEPTRT